MDRTKTDLFRRKNVSTTALLMLESLLTIIGITLLYMINPKTVFGAISIFLYTSVYTPLKTVTSLSVLWVLLGQSLARLGLLRREILDKAGTLFFDSVFWQFHFWAIGWFYEDYEEQVLCQQEEDKGTAQGYFIYRLAV
jgi:protoheme IX farnesyltransferase